MLNLLKTNNMILFIISFFVFILIGYELNYIQAKSYELDKSPAYLSPIEDVNITQEDIIFNDVIVSPNII